MHACLVSDFFQQITSNFPPKTSKRDYRNGM
jgi:hypothetical protein